ncbi:hypothetical protein ACFSJ3_00315 [Corallincola platygyrae]|uniref:Transmembrane protein n=1 Tax=Corallincola platygyrae TaxID=1193278 RepID=A0ABW4XK98_9GAMM
MSLIRLHKLAQRVGVVALVSLCFCIIVICTHLPQLFAQLPTNLASSNVSPSDGIALANTAIADTKSLQASAENLHTHGGYQHQHPHQQPHSHTHVHSGAHADHMASAGTEAHAEHGALQHGEHQHDCCGDDGASHKLVKWVVSILVLVVFGLLCWVVATGKKLNNLTRQWSQRQAFLDPDPPGGYPPKYLQVKRQRN